MIKKIFFISFFVFLLPLSSPIQASQNQPNHRLKLCNKTGEPITAIITYKIGLASASTQVEVPAHTKIEAPYTQATKALTNHYPAKFPGIEINRTVQASKPTDNLRTTSTQIETHSKLVSANQTQVQTITYMYASEGVGLKANAAYSTE